MSTNRISMTLLSVLLGSTLIQTSFQQSAIWCEALPAGTDPSDVACPAIYDPVCAYMKSVPLGVTVSNECVACDQEGYDYYYPGECQGVSQEEEEEEGSNQEESSEGCVDNEEGSNQEEEEGASQEEEEEEGSNQEEEEEGASQEEEEEEGSNQEEEEEEEEENDDKKYKCVRSSSPGNVVCGLIYQPVCAYNYGDDEGTTVGNRCAACEQQDYDYYTNGECENQEEDGNNQEEDEEEEENDEEEGDNQEEEEEEEENDDKKYKCVRSSNPDDVVCGLIYQPVCAYNYGDDEGTTVGNRCTACEQQDYDYYTNGAC